MRFYIRILFVFSFLSCKSVNSIRQKKITVRDLYSYSLCFKSIFDSFEFQIIHNTYTYIFGYKFCQEPRYKFSKKDFDALKIKFNKSTEIELSKFYEYTGTEKKYIYKISRGNQSIIIFGGYSTGAPGRYSDYVEWIIIDVKSGDILLNTQTSLSKYPFVFYFDDNKKLRFINYDYDRENEGYLNVRLGQLPITVQLNSYVVEKEKCILKKHSQINKFYCVDNQFYTNTNITYDK